MPKTSQDITEKTNEDDSTNSEKEKNTRAFIEAVKKGDLGRLDLLISKADLEYRLKEENDEQGKGALEFVFFDTPPDKREEVLNRLLNRLKDYSVAVRERLLNFPVPILRLALGEGSATQVKALLEAGANLHQEISEEYSDFSTAPIAAAMFGYIRVFEVMLIHNPNLLNSRDYNGNTLLHILIKSPQYENLLLQQRYPMIQYLLEKGMDPNVSNHDGFTALMFAVCKGVPELIQLLFNHSRTAVDPNAQNKYGGSALSIAIEADCIDIIGILLDKKANIYQTDKLGMNALDWARHYNRLPIVELLEDYAYLYPKRTFGGYFPSSCLNPVAQKELFEFIKNNQFTFVELEAPNEQGDIPNTLAIEQGHKRLSQTLSTLNASFLPNIQRPPNALSMEQFINEGISKKLNGSMNETAFKEWYDFTALLDHSLSSYSKGPRYWENFDRHLVSNQLVQRGASSSERQHVMSITELEIRRLYDDIFNMISHQFKKAKDTKKKLVIILGETSVSKKSLLIEMLFFYIISLFNIKHYFAEMDATMQGILEGRIQGTVSFPQFGTAEYCRMIARMLGMLEIPIDTEIAAFRTDSPFSILPDPENRRERAMAKAIQDQDEHGLAVVNYNRLAALTSKLMACRELLVVPYDIKANLTEEDRKGYIAQSKLTSESEACKTIQFCNLKGNAELYAAEELLKIACDCHQFFLHCTKSPMDVPSSHSKSSTELCHHKASKDNAELCQYKRSPAWFNDNDREYTPMTAILLQVKPLNTSIYAIKIIMKLSFNAEEALTIAPIQWPLSTSSSSSSSSSSASATLHFGWNKTRALQKKPQWPQHAFQQPLQKPSGAPVIKKPLQIQWQKTQMMDNAKNGQSESNRKHDQDNNNDKKKGEDTKKNTSPTAKK